MPELPATVVTWIGPALLNLKEVKLNDWPAILLTEFVGRSRYTESPWAYSELVVMGAVWSTLPVDATSCSKPAVVLIVIGWLTWMPLDSMSPVSILRLVIFLSASPTEALTRAAPVFTVPAFESPM